MSVCVLVHTDGTRECVKWPQTSVAAHLGGAVTFVGAMNDLQVFLVGVADSTEDVNALARTHPWLFLERDVRGPVVFIASDPDGDEMDVDVPALEARLDELTRAP